MPALADPHSRSPVLVMDPGIGRIEVAMFYGGLVAFTALLVFGALAVMVVLPMVVPGYMSVSIRSESMMPTLQVGDVVIAADHDGAEISAKTVVIYEEPRKHDLVTHRVVSATAEGSYITKGDGSGLDDRAPIPAANIRGEARWIVPYVGQPRVWIAQSRWTHLALTILVTWTAMWLARFAFDPRYDPAYRAPRLYRVVPW